MNEVVDRAVLRPRDATTAGPPAPAARSPWLLALLCLLSCLLAEAGLAQPPRRSVHAPYAKKECTGCHQGQDGLVLKQPEGGLCVAPCHDEVVSSPRRLHGPLNMRDCSSCHLHHESNHPSLLRLAPRQLCLYCHAEGDLSRERHTAPAATRGCLECHDPHGGPDPFFLYEPGRG